MIRAFVRVNPSSTNVDLAAGIKLLPLDCEILLQNYKALDFDHREESRQPLANSSWPEFGKPWSYVQVSLYSNAAMFKSLRNKAVAVWVQLGATDEPPLFALAGWLAHIPGDRRTRGFS
jgi:hypothetical protein